MSAGPGDVKDADDLGCIVDVEGGQAVGAEDDLAVFRLVVVESHRVPGTFGNVDEGCH